MHSATWKFSEKGALDTMTERRKIVLDTMTEKFVWHNLRASANVQRKTKICFTIRRLMTNWFCAFMDNKMTRIVQNGTITYFIIVSTSANIDFPTGTRFRKAVLD